MRDNYPRPQLVRDSYFDLNGEWDIAITKSEERPNEFQDQIIVPFSPESKLSGVNKTLHSDETLWYRKEVVFPREFLDAGHILLHFGAVDQYCEVYINGQLAKSHMGGYTAFSMDILPFMKEEIESAKKKEKDVVLVTTKLLVMVKDDTDASYHSRGKQSSTPGGIWYTPQSGIWQSVWVEAVPSAYIENIRITPDFDHAKVALEILSEETQPCTITCEGKGVSGNSNTVIEFSLPDFIEWSPELPHLYDISVTMGEDRIESYFGMRKFSVDKDSKGIPRLFLNNRPYFHNGILDQGYHCDGLYTAPSDEALRFDIEYAKSMGFNMLRKHIKIEPMRWYYYCDKIGMLVWQDMVNGGRTYQPIAISLPLFTDSHKKDSHYKWFARQDEEGRVEYENELEEMITQLYNCPCIAMWVPFNEAWGQFDSKRICSKIKQMDVTRTIDHASGWCDQGIGELRSYHVYFRRFQLKKDKKGRAQALSEFGGYNCKIEGHAFSEREFGYRKAKTVEEFAEDYKRLYEEEIIPAIAEGLTATVYTQLSDVEDELNGFITYDRKVEKMDREYVKKINDKLFLQ